MRNRLFALALLLVGLSACAGETPTGLTAENAAAAYDGGGYMGSGDRGG